MDIQTQSTYAQQANDYVDFCNRINRFRYRFKNIVTYALLLYKKHYFTLENADWDLDEIIEEIKTISPEPERKLMEKIDTIKCLRASRGFFVASILTFFTRISK